MKKKLYQMSRITMELIKLAGGKFQPEELIGCRYYGKVYEGILQLNGNTCRAVVCNYRFGGAQLIGLVQDENITDKEMDGTIDSLIHFFAMNGKCIKDELGIKRNIYSVILQAAKILAIILAGIMCKRWFQGGYQSGAAIIYLLGCVGLYLLAKASEIFLPAMIDVHIEK